jgi:predicted HD phosphohydrolase
VAAKRYLCATNNNYLNQLSAASVNSLMVQGGPMNPAEVREFEASPHHQEAIKLRLYDVDGKIAGLTIKPASEYRKTLESLLTS